MGTGLPLCCFGPDQFLFPRVTLPSLAGGPEPGRGHFPLLVCSLDLGWSLRQGRRGGRASSEEDRAGALSSVHSCADPGAESVAGAGQAEPWNAELWEARSQWVLRANLASIKASFRATKPFPYVGLGELQSSEGRGGEAS